MSDLRSISPHLPGVEAGDGREQFAADVTVSGGSSAPEWSRAQVCAKVRIRGRPPRVLRPHVGDASVSGAGRQAGSAGGSRRVPIPGSRRPGGPDAASLWACAVRHWGRRPRRELWGDGGQVGETGGG
jgi:hypothetical protein